MVKIRWTKDKIDLLRQYKSFAYSRKQIAEKMGLTESQISNACFVNRILLSKEDLARSRKESGKRAIMTIVKKFGWINWTPHLLTKLKRLKSLGYTNKDIGKKFNTSESAITNACNSYRILPDEQTRDRRALKTLEKLTTKSSIIAQKRGVIKKFDSNLGYILGVLYGDGSTVDMGDKGCVELRTRNKRFAIAFYTALYRYTDIKPKYHIRHHNKFFKNENRLYKNVKYYEVFFNSVYFARNIRKIFGSTLTKEWEINVRQVTNLGPDFCNNLIKGLFDSEGSFTLKKGKKFPGACLSFSTTNEKGAKSLVSLLKEKCYDFDLSAVKRKNQTEYRVRTHKLENILRFFNNIGFSVCYKQQQLKTYIKQRLRNF